jgi:hypothetical protein
MAAPESNSIMLRKVAVEAPWVRFVSAVPLLNKDSIKRESTADYPGIEFYVV